VDLVDTEEMDAFFDKLDRMSQVQLLALQVAWRSTSRQTHEDAWASVRAVSDREALTEEIGRVRNRALAWATRASNAAPWRGNADFGWLEVEGEAGGAIVDAAVAVALSGRLDAGTRDVLMGPMTCAFELSD
jgi:hypothetical protein